MCVGGRGEGGKGGAYPCVYIKRLIITLSRFFSPSFLVVVLFEVESVIVMLMGAWT